MTAQTLRTRSLKDLADMARRRGVLGWHSMRKDQLVRALLQAADKRRLAVPKSDTKKPITIGRGAPSALPREPRIAALPSRASPNAWNRPKYG